MSELNTNLKIPVNSSTIRILVGVEFVYIDYRCSVSRFVSTGDFAVFLKAMLPIPLKNGIVIGTINPCNPRSNKLNIQISCNRPFSL